MEINPVKPPEMGASIQAPSVRQAAQEPAGGQVSFKSLLADALGQVNQLQQNADAQMIKAAAGEPVALDEVMLAVQKAELALQMTTQIRNKLVEAYQEVVRMQI